MNDALLHIFPWLYICSIFLLFRSVHCFTWVKNNSIFMFRVANSATIFFLKIGWPRTNKFAAILPPEVFTVLKFFLESHNLIVTSKDLAHSRRVNLMVFIHHTIIFLLRFYLFDHKRCFCYLFHIFLCTLTFLPFNAFFLSVLFLLKVEVGCLIEGYWVHIFVVLSLLGYRFFLSFSMHKLINWWRILSISLKNAQFLIFGHYFFI